MLHISVHGWRRHSDVDGLLYTMLKSPGLHWQDLCLLHARTVVRLVTCMCRDTSQFTVLGLQSSTNLDLSVSPTCDASQASHIMWYTVPTTLPFSTLISSSLRVLLGFKKTRNSSH